MLYEVITPVFGAVDIFGSRTQNFYIPTVQSHSQVIGYLPSNRNDYSVWRFQIHNIQHPFEGSYNFV